VASVNIASTVVLSFSNKKQEKIKQELKYKVSLCGLVRLI
jgi:hypothetical protein